jgi:large repetitive protein
MSIRLLAPSRLALKARFRLSPKTMVSKAMVLALVVAGFTVLGGGQALASHVGCGDTITTDTTLDSDLIDCPNNGIVIGADNITLDLNGHTIDGDATPVDPCPEGQACDVGVVNLAGHDRLTIRGGTIQQFGVGVLVEGGAAHTRLHQLAANDNTDFGIIVAESTDSVIEQTSMSDNGTSGLILAASRGALVARNSVSGSHGYALNFFEVEDSRIQDNKLDGNDHGLQMVAGSSGNIIRRNVVSHSAGSSIDLGDGAVANRIERNRLIDNGDGIIVVEVQDTLISRNILTGTGSFGFPDTGGFGIVVDGADRTTLDRNILTGGRGPAIFVTVLEAPTVPEDNVVSRNVVTSNLGDGILVDSGATGTLLVRNIASRNGDDGIDVDVPATTLTHNIANRNRDLGIEAVPGVIDGGGNRAAGNGNPAQCTNIECR